MEGSGRDLIWIRPVVYVEGLMKPTTIAGLQAKVWTRPLPTANQHCSQLGRDVRQKGTAIPCSEDKWDPDMDLPGNEP